MTEGQLPSTLDYMPAMYKSVCAVVLSVIFLWAVLTACAQRSRAETHEKVYVGFLDDAREEMLNWKPGVAPDRVIRPAFEKTPTGWSEIDVSSLPSRMTWTIAFDGKNFGQVESEADSNRGLTVFQKILTLARHVPSIGQPSTSFAGLEGMTTKVRRPLVVVSSPYFRDPDGWKRSIVPDQISELVRRTFRHDYPHVDRCKDEEVVERNWKFPDAALTLPVAYSSNRSSFLVETSLNAGDCGYVDDPNDPLSMPWFFVSSDGVVKRVGSFMTLLDAGDYDNDGKSELIFFLSQPEDTDGFVLFDATLQKRAALLWSYH